MGHEWILDVITDLRAFAKQNELPILAAQLDESALVASAEIRTAVGTNSPIMRGDSAETRQFSASVGTSRRA